MNMYNAMSQSKYTGPQYFLDRCWWKTNPSTYSYTHLQLMVRHA